MAESRRESSHQNLVCPVCLDIFKNAVLLRCGHTFCKKCLEENDRTHQDRNCMVCPVCRKATKLGPKRIESLIPNVSINGLVDEINAKKGSSLGDKESTCSDHDQIKCLFCQDCQVRICFYCVDCSHQGHSIKTGQDFESDLKAKNDNHHESWRKKKARVMEQINSVETERGKIQSHLHEVKEHIENECKRKIEIIKGQRLSFLEKIALLSVQTDRKLDDIIKKHKQIVAGVERTMTSILIDNLKTLEGNRLTAYNQRCSDLDNLLQQAIDEESARLVREAVESTQFEPAEDKLLTLGQVDVSKTEIVLKSQQTVEGPQEELQNERISMEASSSQETKQFPFDSVKVAGKEQAGDGKSMSEGASVRRWLCTGTTYDLSEEAACIAVISEDTVIVGYGDMKFGSDAFDVFYSEYRYHEVGEIHVWDIAILSNHQKAISVGDKIMVYCDFALIFEYESLDIGDAGRVMLGSDHLDNIYAITCNSAEIFVFHGENRHAQRVISTGSFVPEHIWVTKKGVLITSTCRSWPNSLRVFDKDGHEGSCLVAFDDGEYFCAAIDSNDKVYVARVKENKDMIRLTAYTLEGTTLIQQQEFQGLSCNARVTLNSSMVCLKPDLFAFASGNNLIFFDVLPE